MLKGRLLFWCVCFCLKAAAGRIIKIIESRGKIGLLSGNVNFALREGLRNEEDNFLVIDCVCSGALRNRGAKALRCSPTRYRSQPEKWAMLKITLMR